MLCKMTRRVFKISACICAIFLAAATIVCAHHPQDAQDMTEMPMVKPDGAVVVLKTDHENIAAGIAEAINISIKDSAGKPEQELTMLHDRILHVVIASRDFTVFSHIHPEDFGPVTAAMKEKAQFPVKYAFPKAGNYILGIDFAVKGQAYSKKFVINVAGDPKMGAPITDFSRTRKFGDYDVSLKAAPEIIAAGKEMTLTYQFSKDGSPVTDLEPYLSATMHASIISSDLDIFIHEHGQVPGMESMGMHGHHMHDMSVPGKFGPEIKLSVVFPSKGVYEIFGEVKHKGKIILTQFMVKVE
jgi:hypothetical protein